MSISKNFTIPQNVNSRTPAFWIGPQIKDMEIINDEVFFRGELYAKKIADKNREKITNSNKGLIHLQEQEKPKENKPKEEKTTEKKSKKEDIIEKKTSSDIFIDIIGERSRIWDDIYCTVSNNKDIIHKPIILYSV